MDQKRQSQASCGEQRLVLSSTVGQLEMNHIYVLLLSPWISSMYVKLGKALRRRLMANSKKLKVAVKKRKNDGTYSVSDPYLVYRINQTICRVFVISHSQVRRAWPQSHTGLSRSLWREDLRVLQLLQGFMI